MTNDNYKCTGKGCRVKETCGRYAKFHKKTPHKFAPFEQYCIEIEVIHPHPEWEDTNEYYWLYQ